MSPHAQLQKSTFVDTKDLQVFTSCLEESALTDFQLYTSALEQNMLCKSDLESSQQPLPLSSLYQFGTVTLLQQTALELMNNFQLCSMLLQSVQEQLKLITLFLYQFVFCRDVCNEGSLLRPIRMIYLPGVSPPHELMNLYRKKEECYYLDLSKKLVCIDTYKRLGHRFRPTKYGSLHVNHLQKRFRNLHKYIVHHYKDIFKDLEGKQQLAWAALAADDGSFDFFEPKPPVEDKHCKKAGSKHDSAKTKHSEDFLIDEILEVIRNSKKVYRELYIYSVNSPCLGRKGHHPCIMNLTDLSNQLGMEHNIKTYIGFSNYYACGDLQNYLPNIRFCKYEIPSHIEKLVSLNQTQSKGRPTIQCQEDDLLCDIYLKDVETTKFSFKPDTRTFLKSLQKAVDQDQTLRDKQNSKKYIAVEITANISEICTVEEASLSELKQMAERKFYQLFGENDPRVSPDLKYTFLKCWSNELNKLIYNSISGHIEKKLVQFFIENIECIQHHPTFVHVDLNSTFRLRLRSTGN